MDTLLVLGVVLLVLALLGFGGLVEVLAGAAWVLLIAAVLVLAWRVITDRRPV